jgi:hypothetical protein
MQMIPMFEVEERSPGLLVRAAASRREMISLLASHAASRAAFSKIIADVPYDGLFWEVAPINAATAERPFECMILPSAAVAALTVDAQPFGGLLVAEIGSDAVVRQRNLAGDAELIIPCDANRANYAHLAVFLRTASGAQVDNLWRETGEAALRWLNQMPDKTLWLSTSGLGVAWLHVRLDTRPKYYSYAPYRAPNA